MFALTRLYCCRIRGDLCPKFSGTTLAQLQNQGVVREKRQAFVISMLFMVTVRVGDPAREYPDKKPRKFLFLIVLQW